MKIAFYKARYGDWTDYAIALFTLGAYSHVELVFSNGVWFSASPRDGGVRYKRIEPKELHWAYLDLPISEEEEVALQAWCDREVGCKYDWKEVFRFVLPFLGADNSRWFCSEIVMAALQQLGLFKKNRKKDHSPNSLYKLLIDSGFKVVV